MWRIVALGALVAMASARASHARACSCPARSLEEGTLEARAIFDGTVTQIVSNSSTPFGGMHVTLRVARVWKSEIGPKVGDELGAQVTVVTASNGAVCGFPFRIGGRYLVYAFADAQDEPLRVSLCSLTKPIEEAKADLKHLGKPVLTHSDEGRSRGCQTGRSLPSSNPAGFVLILALFWLSRRRLRSSPSARVRAR